VERLVTVGWVDSMMKKCISKAIDELRIAMVVSMSKMNTQENTYQAATSRRLVMKARLMPASPKDSVQRTKIGR
jgi:hypothetical protein